MLLLRHLFYFISLQMCGRAEIKQNNCCKNHLFVLFHSHVRRATGCAFSVVYSMDLKWVAGVFAAVVGVVLIGVMYSRYKVIKRRRQIACYENMGN